MKNIKKLIICIAVFFVIGNQLIPINAEAKSQNGIVVGTLKWSGKNNKKVTATTSKVQDHYSYVSLNTYENSSLVYTKSKKCKSKKAEVSKSNKNMTHAMGSFELYSKNDYFVDGDYPGKKAKGTNY